jgi:hypothetical protein
MAPRVCRMENWMRLWQNGLTRFLVPYIKPSFRSWINRVYRYWLRSATSVLSIIFSRSGLARGMILHRQFKMTLIKKNCRLIINWLFKKCSTFYGTQDSLSFLQEPTIKTYPELENPVHILTTYLFDIPFNIILPSTCTSLKWYFSSGIWN